MRCTWDNSREYVATKVVGNPKSRPWSVAIVSGGDVSGHAGEFTSKAAALAYATLLASGGEQ